MEITWLGHSALRIRGTRIVLVADPYDSSNGTPMARMTADIVTVSHDHPHHSYTQAVEGNPRILKGPGEYEIANFYISGIGMPLRAVKIAEDEPEAGEEERARERQINTVFIYRAEGLSICHLGGINRELSPRQAEGLNQADVLIVPVGGRSTISVDKVAQLVNLIGPRIVIPVQYRIEGTEEDLEPLDSFLNEIGVSDVSPQAKLNVTATNLPRDLSVVALQRVS